MGSASTLIATSGKWKPRGDTGSQFIPSLPSGTPGLQLLFQFILCESPWEEGNCAAAHQSGGFLCCAPRRQAQTPCSSALWYCPISIASDICPHILVQGLILAKVDHTALEVLWPLYSTWLRAHLHYQLPMEPHVSTLEKYGLLTCMQGEAAILRVG